jgi:hypothetical protein
MAALINSSFHFSQLWAFSISLRAVATSAVPTVTKHVLQMESVVPSGLMR